MIISTSFRALQKQLLDFAAVRDQERDPVKAQRLQAAISIAANAHTLMPADALEQLRQAETMCDFSPYIRAILGMMIDQLDNRTRKPSVLRKPASLKPHSRNMGAHARSDAPGTPPGEYWWNKQD